MRCLLLNKLGKPEDLILTTLPNPKPGDGELVVDMYAAAVNFADILSIAGEYQFKPKLPFVPGREGAGIVSEVGKNVSRFKPGDRVMLQTNFGAFAQKAVAKEHETYRVPDNINLNQAAAVGVAFQTAWFALTDRAQVRKGETVMVTGASGSVGLAAVQLAHTWGCRVLAGLTTPSKAGIVRKAGADLVVDLTSSNPKEEVRNRVMDLTNGEGVDIVLDLIGGEIFSGALRCLKFRGRMVVVGFTSGNIANMKTNYVLIKNISVTGIDRTYYRDYLPEWMDEAQTQIFDYIGDKRISMPIQEILPINDFLSAFNIIRNRKVEGKVILKIKEE